MISLLKSKLVTIVMLRLFLTKILVIKTAHFWQQTQNMKSSWIYCILGMTKMTKYRIFDQIFDKICIFWGIKNGFFGDKILWCLCISKSTSYVLPNHVDPKCSKDLCFYSRQPDTNCSCLTTDRKLVHCMASLSTSQLLNVSNCNILLLPSFATCKQPK